MPKQDENDAPQAPPSKPKAAPKATSSSEKKPPQYWLQRLQRFTLGPKMGKRPRVRVPHWQHAAAAALHGWGQHAHDEQAPIMLSESDYTKALEAAESNPPKPHKGALSKHCRLTFKG